MVQGITGAVLAAAVALLALRTRSLTASGAWAAWVTGTLVFAAGGWPYAAVLFAFFIPSTLLSRVGRTRKRALVDVGKQGARDSRQVAANGGIAAACAVLAALTHAHAFAAACAGAFAAASADTWGTEIGTLARRPPRSIWTFQPLATGLSGGMSDVGTLAQALGALAVGCTASAVGMGAWWSIAIAGFTGALVDSLLGATLQELRYCPACGRACETNPHACGRPTVLRRGSVLISNDAVNACASAAGALVAGMLTLYIG